MDQMRKSFRKKWKINQVEKNSKDMIKINYIEINFKRFIFTVFGSIVSLICI